MKFRFRAFLNVEIRLKKLNQNGGRVLIVLGALAAHEHK
jgi:hypothetical protein